jgi:hypothetical protein
MLQYFFEDARENDGRKRDNRSLFEGLRIMEEGEKYLSKFGKYPVISLSLKSAKQPNFEEAYMALRTEIAGEFKRHSFIAEHECLFPDEKELFLKLMLQKGEKAEYNQSLKFLSSCMKKYYGKKAMILIDEYDVPLENSFFRGFYEEMADFLRSLFESALKTNSSLEFAVLTGCLRISKESIFTGMNNLKIISILSDKYDEHFGFTEAEVRKICEDYGMNSKIPIFEEWYDGYLFGNKNVYNPWSVIQFADDLQENEERFPYSYWANTSSNSIVRSLIERADDEIKSEIEALIEGKSVVKPIHEDITYDEVYKSMDNLWNFMFFTGYFRKVREWMDERTKQHFVELAIPNQEIKYIFRMKILTWFDEKLKEKDRSELFTALVNQDVEKLEDEIVDLLMETISFNDAYESFYHGFLAGILSGMKGYIVKSNREGGKGRSDLFVKPVTRRKAAFVIEFKVAKRFEELEAKAGEALRQIEEKRYADELHGDGYQEVIRYGIAFFGKDCVVRA